LIHQEAQIFLLSNMYVSWRRGSYYLTLPLPILRFFCALLMLLNSSNTLLQQLAFLLHYLLTQLALSGLVWLLHLNNIKQVNFTHYQRP
jgi:hypothetical protein